MTKKTLRPIAIYLPQYHPIPENDEWWGKGFTEWRNVTKARPRFRDHYQPHLPADLGFYDLRLDEVRNEQAELAKAYGIYGFCYYHYWFNGRRILERPFQEVFESGRPDFPFMLCWANENWTRVWDGGENAVLLRQEYSAEDDLDHVRALIPYFKDKRYISIDGRPVFAIYKDSLFPDIRATTKIFRDECKKAGIDIYLCRFERYKDSRDENLEELGFDASVEFQPLSKSWGAYTKEKKAARGPLDKLWVKVRRKWMPSKQGENNIYDMRDFVNYDLNRPPVNYKRYPGVSPGWDNSCRRVGKTSTIFINSLPEVFKRWVAGKAKSFEPYSPEENLFFINAWNEWAEGNHLEPDLLHGHAYLKALQEGLLEGNDDRTNSPA